MLLIKNATGEKLIENWCAICGKPINKKYFICYDCYKKERKERFKR